MKKLFFILALFFWAMPSGFAQLRIHSFEEAEKLAQENPKPLVIFIHTSWCKYCKMMDNVTFKNPEIISRLNTDFYFIALDSESQKRIVFRNHTFRFQPTGKNTGIHELATELASVNHEIVYPTLTILDSDFSILTQLSSYRSPKEVMILLKEMKKKLLNKKN